MQSLRQYRQLHESVKQWHAGNSKEAYSPHSLEGATPQSGSPSRTLPDADSKEDDDVHVVEWDGPSDPANPRNWPLLRRAGILFILWINVFALDWAGSADSQASSKISKQFHVSEEAETLSPALYNFGIGLGALFAGPISGKMACGLAGMTGC